jgi:hypothetical protein
MEKGYLFLRERDLLPYFTMRGITELLWSLVSIRFRLGNGRKKSKIMPRHYLKGSAAASEVKCTA